MAAVGERDAVGEHECAAKRREVYGVGGHAVARDVPADEHRALALDDPPARLAPFPLRSRLRRPEANPLRKLHRAAVLPERIRLRVDAPVDRRPAVLQADAGEPAGIDGQRRALVAQPVRAEEVAATIAYANRRRTSAPPPRDLIARRRDLVCRVPADRPAEPTLGQVDVAPHAQYAVRELKLLKGFADAVVRLVNTLDDVIAPSKVEVVGDVRHREDPVAGPRYAHRRIPVRVGIGEVGRADSPVRRIRE